MSTELLIAIVAGVFSIVGAAIGAGFTVLGSYLEHRRVEKKELQSAADRERAVFHGAFAVCNFIAAKLNEWDRNKNVPALARLSVAQPYLAKLIDRSPPDSERLMVSLVDLGLRLEALMFSTGVAVGGENFNLSELEREIEELGTAVEVVQIILTGELPMMDDEELASFPGFEEIQDEEEAPKG